MSASLNRHRQFASLHTPGRPLVLYNAWDAASAAVIAKAGAAAIATGSWSVAAAQGYDDGEQIPLAELLLVARNIVRRVDLPVSLDFESGYARDARTLTQHARAVVDCGVIGVNFEDQNISAGGVYTLDEQTQRVAAVRAAAPRDTLWINARTDLFLNAPPEQHAALMDEAMARADAYAAAGGDSVFLPGLVDLKLIETACRDCRVPVNVMAVDGGASVRDLAAAGVARISHGPGPMRQALARLAAAAADIYAQ